MKLTYKSTLHACYFGYITQAIINNLTPLLFIIFQNSYHISFEMLGRLILLNFGTQLIVDALAVKYVDRIGYRKSIVMAHFFSAAGLIALGTLPVLLPSPYTGLSIAVVIYAIGGGLIEVLVSPIVDSLPGEAKASAMSLLHSFYSWGQVAVVAITTLLLSVIGHGIWYILPIVWASIPIYNMFRFIKVPLVPGIPEHEKIPIKKLLSSKVFLTAMILMLCAGASELAMSQWSSLFAEKGLQVPKVVGDLLGPCLFGVLMGIGRTIYGIWGHKIPLFKALVASAALCVVCYLITVLVQIPAISLMSCALCGLAVSLMWPGVFSLTAERYPTGGTAMFGILAIFGDLGCSFGPWLTGFVSDIAQKSSALLQAAHNQGLRPEQMGLKAGLFVAALFPLIMLVGLLLFRRNVYSK